ncbi:MAG: hypothetical protein MJ145_00205 [Clostridia bacterium]|nr:hypothetical protein [Clostridia bacterium]
MAPLFIIGSLILLSITTMYGICESINYSICDELSLTQAKSVYTPVDLSTEKAIKKRVNEGHSISDFNISSYRYRYRGLLYKQQIKLDYSCTFKTNTIIDVGKGFTFSESIALRAFTGDTQSDTPTSEAEFMRNAKYEAVYVFPESGMRYHKASCTYVKSNPKKTSLSASIKGKYDACRICGASAARMGDTVYIFQYGGSYHLKGCKTIDKYVIEMDRDDAIEKGFSACKKCGG